MAGKPLILFDLISTITDAGPRYAKAYCTVANQYGIHVPAESDILNELGQNHLKGIIAQHSPDLPEDRLEDFIKDCNQTCDAMLSQSEWVENLYPHARNALSFLKQNNFMLGIYTGTRMDAAMAQLRYHDIEHYFEPDFIQAKDSKNSHYKNSAELKSDQMDKIVNVYAQRQEENKTTAPLSIIVVGDTLSDFEAAKSKHLPFIGFANTPRKSFVFAQAGIQNVFESYNTAPDKIISVLKMHSLHSEQGKNLDILPVREKIFQ